MILVAAMWKRVEGSVLRSPLTSKYVCVLFISQYRRTNVQGVTYGGSHTGGSHTWGYIQGGGDTRDTYIH